MMHSLPAPTHSLHTHPPHTHPPHTHPPHTHPPHTAHPPLTPTPYSLAASLPPSPLGVTNAFVIMLIIMSMYAIIGVEIFSTFGKGGTFITVQQTRDPLTNALVYPNTTVSSETMRGFDFGEEYFGTFSRALFTLFQVLTGESWAEMVARPLIFGYTPSNSLLPSFYFSSYIVLMQIVLINVVVAVLLDKFVEEDPAAEEDDDGAAAGGSGGSGEAAGASATASVSVVFDESTSKANTTRASGKQASASGKLPPPGAASCGGSGSGGGTDAQLHALRSDVSNMTAKLEGVAAMRLQMERLAQSFDALAARGGMPPSGAASNRSGGGDEGESLNNSMLRA